MLNIRLRKLAGLGAVALLVVAGVAFVACSGSDDATTVADTSADEAAHVEGDEAAHDEADDGSADMGDMDMGDDEAAHEEGDEHEADGDADANDYLEAAPKDALYLVEMTNFAFTPNVLEVNADEVLEIAVQNVEPVLHDFTIDVIDADVHISYLGGTGQHAHAEVEKDADVHFALTEPGSGVVHIKVHEPGEYVFYCTVPGHREAGMEGTLIVR
ncbi:MAG: multicopper oxidase domain-containing protein [Chloroflexi bacterium]|nr:multicopper oxidase domain-containing protein [Chloroflexota bacterium]